MVYFANMNGMYNNALRPVDANMIDVMQQNQNYAMPTAFGGAGTVGGGGGYLPTTTAAPMAQSGMTNPGGAVAVADPNPAQGFIPASEGQVAPYNPATGQSGFVDQTQQDAYGRFTTSPDYLFRFNEGQRMLDSSAAARGTLMSGNQLRALTELGQNLASGEYGNYMNRLYGVAGLSQPVNTANYAQMASNTLAGQANAAGNLASNTGNVLGAEYGAYGELAGNLSGDIFGGIKQAGGFSGGMKKIMGMF